MTLWTKISQNLWIQLTSEQFSHKLICNSLRMSYLLCPDQSSRKSRIWSKLAASDIFFWKSAFWWDIAQFFGPCRGLTHPEGCICPLRQGSYIFVNNDNRFFSHMLMFFFPESFVDAQRSFSWECWRGVWLVRDFVNSFKAILYVKM